MTNAELALLGLIVEQPRHGYEIEQVIEARGMRDWTEIGFSSIYYLLKKLESKGFIHRKSPPAPGSGPTRKIYHPTAEGRGEWYQQSLACLAEPDQSSGRLLLGLSALPALDAEDIRQALQKYQDRLVKQLSHMDARAEAQQPLLPSVEAMFDYSRMRMQSEIEWVGNLVKDVASGKFSQQERN